MVDRQSKEEVERALNQDGLLECVRASSTAQHLSSLCQIQMPVLRQGAFDRLEALQYKPGVFKLALAGILFPNPEIQHPAAAPNLPRGRSPSMKPSNLAKSLPPRPIAPVCVFDQG